MTSEQLNTRNMSSSSSSVRALVGRTGRELQDLLQGPDSLGSLMEQGGHLAVPSPRQPGPGQELSYQLIRDKH